MDFKECQIIDNNYLKRYNKNINSTSTLKRKVAIMGKKTLSIFLFVLSLSIPTLGGKQLSTAKLIKEGVLVAFEDHKSLLEKGDTIYIKKEGGKQWSFSSLELKLMKDTIYVAEGLGYLETISIRKAVVVNTK